MGRKPRKPGKSFGGRRMRMHAPNLGELVFDDNGYAVLDLGAFGTQPIHKRNVALVQTIAVTIAFDALRLNLEREETMKLARFMLQTNAREEMVGQSVKQAGPSAVPEVAEQPSEQPSNDPIDAAIARASATPPPAPSKKRGFFERLFGRVEYSQHEQAIAGVEHEHAESFGDRFEAAGIESQPGDPGFKEFDPMKKPVWVEERQDGEFVRHDHAGIVDDCSCPVMPDFEHAAESATS